MAVLQRNSAKTMPEQGRSYKYECPNVGTVQNFIQKSLNQNHVNLVIFC